MFHRYYSWISRKYLLRFYAFNDYYDHLAGDDSLNQAIPADG